MGHVVDDGVAERAHDRKRAHVDDEVVVAEAEAALGDEDALVAGGRDLGDRVPHVAGREELALLDVDDAAGARRGDEQIGLPREERRNLQHVGDFGRRRRVRRLVDVGQDRARRLVRAPRASTRRPSSRPGPRNEPPDVRLALSYEALKMYGTPSATAMSRIAMREAEGVRFALDDARAGDEHAAVRRRS